MGKRFDKDGFRIVKKWWHNPDEDKYERAGWLIECIHGDLAATCRNSGEVMRRRREHINGCVVPRMFPVE